MRDRSGLPGERLIRLVLACAPRAFRARHARDLIECHRDAWQAEAEGRSRSRAAAFWLRAAVGTGVTVVRLWWERLAGRGHGRRREAMGMDGLMHEIRYSMRRIRRRPGFALVVVTTLGLGLGANTAVFSVLHSVLLSPLPYQDSEQLVRVYGSVRDRAGEEFGYLSGPAALELRDAVESLEGVALLENYAAEGADLTGGDRPERVRMLRVGAGYFDVLRVAPMLGRTFRRADETADSRVAVVREDVWRRFLDARPEAVGRSLVVDGEPLTVVGVVSDAVRDPLEGPIDIWVPSNLGEAALRSWDDNYLTAVARLAPEADLRALRAELAVVVERHAEISDLAALKGYTAIPLQEDLVGDAQPLLVAIMGAVLFLLILTCVNVASLLLARAAGRERELAVRASLGSSRTRLVRQFMIETGLLSVAGGVAGVLIGAGALDLLLAIAPEGLPRRDGVELGIAAVAAGAVGAIVIGLVLGFATALPFTGGRVEGVTSGVRGGPYGAGRPRLRATLAASEVALAVVLLSGAGLFLRTVHRLQTRDVGADAHGVLTFEVGLPDARYPTDEARYRFNERLHERIAAIPGVTSAAATSRLPVTGNFNSWGMRRAVAVGELFDAPNTQVNQRWIAGEHFETAGLELRAGRDFSEEEGADAPYGTVVNETLARGLFGDEDPLGQLLYTGGRFTRVIGVVEDEALNARSPATPIAYHHQRQWISGSGRMTQMVKVDGEASSLVPALRLALAEIDPELVLFRPRMLGDVIGADSAEERFAARLLLAFSGLAVLLAGLGLYGVLSNRVGGQRHEIGVRMALGADGGSVRRMVVRGGLQLALAGALVGTALSLALGGVLQRFMFEVSARDPVVLGAAPAFLLVIAVVASYLPARRATRIDPMESFRAD